MSKDRSTRETKKKEERTARPTHGTRIEEVSAERPRLEVPGDIKDMYPADQHFYWEADEKGAVEARLRRGWLVVEDDHGPITLKAGRGATVDDLNLKLMTICDEYWQKDAEARRKQNAAPLESLKKSQESTGAAQTSGGEYSPSNADGSFGYSEKTETIS